MFPRMHTPFPLFFVFTLFCALGGSVLGQDHAAENPVILGREFQNMPWLEQIGDAPFEIIPYDSIPLLTGIPRETEYYRIESDVVLSGYTFFFCVHGVDAVYVVGSMVNLAKLCHELAVMEEIKRRNKGKEFAAGIGDSVKGIGTGLANMVAHPGISFKSFGTRIRQTGRSVERAVGGGEKVGRDATGSDRSNLGGGPAGQERRHLAFDLGVDVYTSNPVLQHALIEMSQLRVAGGLVTWAVPYHIGLLSNMNPLFGNEVAELRIRDFDPYELRRLVGKDLEPIFGMSREDHSQPLAALLFNPNYTPRNISYIGVDLEYLRTAANLDVILCFLAGADTPELADLLSLELRLYSFLHRRIEPIREFEAFRNVFAAIGANTGKMHIVFPGDMLRPWHHTAEAFGELLQEAAAVHAAGVEIWVLGSVEPVMVENANQYGVVVRQNVLRDPVFFPGAEQNITGN